MTRRTRTHGYGCSMNGLRVEPSAAWAQDTALLGSNRSGAPGAKTERRAMASSLARLSQTSFGIGTKAINPAGRSPASYETKKPRDGLPVVANSARRELHFTLNQYRGACDQRTCANPHGEPVSRTGPRSRRRLAVQSANWRLGGPGRT